MTAPHDLRDWAALYRQARRPPASLAAQVFDTCRADADRSLADDSHADDSLTDLGAVEVPAPASERWALGLGIGALIGVAALLALTWSMDAIRSTPANDTRLEAPMQAAPQTSPGQITPRSTTGARRPNTPSTLAPAPAPEPEPEPSQASATSPKPRPRAVTPTSDTSPTRRSEDLESMRRLRAAEAMLLRDPRAAREALERHGRDYPSSAMMLEREALWLRAACLSGSGKEVERRRKAFFQRADVGAYRDAIRRACDEGTSGQGAARP